MALVLRLLSLLHLLNLQPFLPHASPLSLNLRGALCVLRKLRGLLAVVSAFLVVRWETRSLPAPKGSSNARP